LRGPRGYSVAAVPGSAKPRDEHWPPGCDCKRRAAKSIPAQTWMPPRLLACGSRWWRGHGVRNGLLERRPRQPGHNDRYDDGCDQPDPEENFAGSARFSLAGSQVRKTPERGANIDVHEGPGQHADP